LDDIRIKIYGISQDLNTKDYIIVLHNVYCNKCCKYSRDMKTTWCQQCEKNNLKKNFASWTSGNEKIDNLIQELYDRDIVVEWIPYSQFNNIKELGENKSATIYSAIWKDGLFKI
jgi:hypothetical protein